MVLENYNGIVRYDLINDSHPIFNIWRATTVTGEHYDETFYKNENPNKGIKSIEHRLNSKRERGDKND